MRVTVYTAQQLSFSPASQGESDFINNFLHFYPGALLQLPCGCSYQWSAARRQLLCPSQPLRIVTGDGSAGSSGRHGNELHRALFRHWMDWLLTHSLRQPAVPTVSAAAPSEPDAEEGPPAAAFGPVVMTGLACPLQPAYGNSTGHALPPDDHFQYGAAVSILSRTSLQREALFHDLRQSVLHQSYPEVCHVLAVDHSDSLRYAAADVTLLLPQPALHEPPRCLHGQALPYSYSSLAALQRHARPDSWLLYLDNDRR